MKKITMTLVAFAITATFTACKWNDVKETVGCAAQNTVKTAVATVVAQELTCKNTAAIEADIEAQLAKTKICKQEEINTGVSAAAIDSKSIVGDLICTPVVDGLLAQVANTIPATWECDPSAKVEPIKAKLIEKCKASL